jgi:hypothetical protein
MLKVSLSWQESKETANNEPSRFDEVFVSKFVSFSPNNRFYTKKTRNRPNYKNNEFVCSTADCYATVFLAVTLILGGNVITEPLSKIDRKKN